MSNRSKKIPELTSATSISNTDLLIIEQFGVNTSTTKKVTANTLATYIATQVGAVSGTKGEKGDPGAAGTAGTKGDKGDAGTTGLTGAKGDVGENGTAGAKGDKGDVGTSGAAGDKGNKGDTGPQGVTGNDGPQGIQGVRGLQGVSVTLQGTKALVADLPAAPLDPNDFAGYGWIVTEGGGDLWFWNLTEEAWNNVGPIVGPEGPQGEQGVKGEQGPQGVTGNPGAQGDTGPAGNDGAPGADALWNFTGAYGGGASYAVGDVATYEGETWYRIDSNGGNTGDTPAEGTFWTKIAEKGADGAKGERAEENKLVNGLNEVVLDSDGTLTLTGGGKLSNIYPGLSLDDSTWFVTDAGGGVTSTDGAQYVQVNSGNNGIHIGTNWTTEETNVKEWIFRNDGDLRLPDGGAIRTSYGYIDEDTDVANNALRIGGGNGVVIKTDDNGSTWEFDNVGNLTLPANGDILDSSGTSVLGGSGSGLTIITPEDYEVPGVTTLAFAGAGVSVDRIEDVTTVTIPGGSNVTERSIVFPGGAVGDSRGTLALTPDGDTYICVDDYQEPVEPTFPVEHTTESLGQGEAGGGRVQLNVDLRDYPDLLSFIESNPELSVGDTEVSADDGASWIEVVAYTGLSWEQDPPFLSVEFVSGDAPEDEQEYLIKFVPPVTAIWKRVDGNGDIVVDVASDNTSLTISDKDFNIVTTRTDSDNDADIHLTAADDIWIEAEGDSAYLSAKNDVRIGTGWVDGEADKTWTFNDAGAITFPDNTVQTTAYTGGNANTGNVVFDGNQMYVGGTGFLNLETDTGVAVIGTNGPQPLLVSINEDDKIWSFDPDGSITFPDDTVQTTAYTGQTNGDATVARQDTAPTANNGTLWFNTVEARTYIKYNDQWVDASPVIIPPPQTDIDVNSITFADASVLTSAAALGTTFENSTIQEEDDELTSITGNDSVGLSLTSDEWAQLMWVPDTDAVTLEEIKEGGSVYNWAYVDNGGFTIENKTTEGEYEWKFDTDGDLTLPAGGDIKNSSGTSLLPPQGEYLHEFTGLNTDFTFNNLTFNLLYCAAAVGYSGSDTHNVNLPAGTPGQRLVVVNISSNCTLTVNGAAQVTAVSGPAEFIYSPTEGSWIPLYGTV